MQTQSEVPLQHRHPLIMADLFLLSSFLFVATRSAPAIQFAICDPISEILAVIVLFCRIKQRHAAVTVFLLLFAYI